MRSLTEQVTFKVSSETLAQLQQRGRTQGLDANPYARKLVEEGLDRDRTENLADEFRELLAVLRPIADRIAGAPSESQTQSTSASLSTRQLEALDTLLRQTLDHLQRQSGADRTGDPDQQQSITLLANQLVELRADLNKTFAALLHYKMDFSVEEAQRWVDVRLSR
jgi:hypothetical protein